MPRPDKMSQFNKEILCELFQQLTLRIKSTRKTKGEGMSCHIGNIPAKQDFVHFYRKKPSSRASRLDAPAACRQTGAGSFFTRAKPYLPLTLGRGRVKSEEISTFVGQNTPPKTLRTPDT